MLGLSAIIGIYFGCIKGGQDTISGYLLGGKKMPIFPISMSLIASYISGITLLGIPSETYLYGTQLYAIVLANFIVTIVILIFYLPVLHPLQYNSVFEYLEKRFSHSVRCIASITYAIFLVTYIPVVIYVPALAFSQVTGISVQRLAPIICAVCVFYTTLGGLKAVVWSDAVQSIFTLASILAVTIIGCRVVGGLGNVFDISDKGHRLEFFNMDPDIFARNTFWTVVIGSSFSWFALVGLNPGTVQRFTALPNLRDARIAAIICCIGITVIKSVATINGLVIYTKYHGCDPVKIKVIEKADQILPYYVMEIAKDYPGLSGLFISGIVSTALSTMSTGLNVISGTIYEDFLKPCLPKKHTERQASVIMKCTVCVLGVVFLSMVFVVEKLGAILQLAISLGGLSLGTICFVFTFGMFLPWATTKVLKQNNQLCSNGFTTWHDKCATLN
ncbi:hypothetical protein AAG570_013606 [Ranatra chinensis]|uniref:Sodium-coupled monocarboxylate transporter 1 n=1 Tax=Ranatra chinensis TaxID=642074 RepID=A0ABD0Z0Y4_9HEMI